MISNNLVNSPLQTNAVVTIPKQGINFMSYQIYALLRTGSICNFEVRGLEKTQITRRNN